MVNKMSFEPLNTCDGSRVHPNGERQVDASLSVRITAACNSACDFCIAAEDMKTSYPFDLEKVVDKTLESGAREISLIGGEPLLFVDRCLEYVSRIRDSVDEVYITTNLAPTIERDWDKFVELMDKTNYMTVSLQSVDNDVNNDLLNTKTRFDRMALLRRILATKDFADKVTINLNLVLGGVDSKEEFDFCLSELKSWGVRHVRVNELMFGGEDYVNFEDMMGVDLGDPYTDGCKLSLDLDSELDVILKRSCFLVENSLEASERDLAKIHFKKDNPTKFMVPGWRILYENGEYDLKWRNTRKEREEVYKNLPIEPLI